jgi:uncharacterized protein YndB with AHSA1/START domain
MTPTTAVSRALEVTTQVASTVEEIFSYLTTASLMERWLCSRAESDVKKGGKFSLWIEPEEAGKPRIYGQFVNIVENRTIQYAWIDAAKKLNSLVTVVLNQKASQVRIDLYHTSLPMEETFDDSYYAYAKYWKNAFDKLIEHLST